MIRLPISSVQVVWLYRLGLFTALAGISWLAFTSQTIPSVQSMSDKVNHGFAFFTLSLLIDNAFPRWRFLWIKVWPLLAYGILIEIVQHFVERSPSVLDVLADCAGILLYWLMRQRLRRLVVGKPDRS